MYTERQCHISEGTSQMVQVTSRLIMSTKILITYVRMNHFDHLPLLELNFSFESLQRFRLLTIELNKTITEIIINKRDEIFVATHRKRSEWPINICMNNPKQLSTSINLGIPNVDPKICSHIFIFIIIIVIIIIIIFYYCYLLLLFLLYYYLSFLFISLFFSIILYF